MEEKNNNVNETNNNETNNNQELFETKEIKQVGSSATEEMDTSFVEPKKHHVLPIILVVLLLAIVGGCCLYYFVLNTPKKTYSTIINKLAQNDVMNVVNGNNNESLNYKYDLALKLSSSDKDVAAVFDIINKMTISGESNYDNDKLIQNSVVNYKGGKLLDATYMVDIKSKIMYVRLNDVLDKTIKLDASEDESVEELLQEVDFDKEDYTKIYNSILNAIKFALENADYERKITKLDSGFVFQEKLLVNKNFYKSIVTKLLQDTEFLQTMAKLTDTSVSDIHDDLNDSLSDLPEEVTTISVYKTILKNEIVKVEIENEDVKFNITKDGNKYNYELIESYDVVFKGYIKEETINDEKKIAFSIEMVEEDITLEVNASYSKSNNKITIDTSNAVDYTELDEKDLEKVMKYITENKTVNELLEDTGLNEMISTDDSDM